MGKRWEDFVITFYSKILPLIAFIVVIVGVVMSSFQDIFLKIEIGGGEAFRLLTYISLLILVVITLFAIYQIALIKDISESLDKLSKDIRELLVKKLPKSGSNPKEIEKEERVETSGAGALGGMVVGGVLGLPFGPVGIIIGGIIGALLGNQIEYEIRRARD
ncbi:MAG: hypothetical protein ACXQTS_05675 [Candidatus Methanospirareceae archaeon]